MSCEHTYLPAITTIDEYRTVRADADICRNAIIAICARHHLDPARLNRYTNGSTIVFGVGADHVVKLFAPMFRRNYETERLALQHIDGRLTIRTPKLLASGDLDGWPYIVMEQMRGENLKDMWDDLTSSEQLSLSHRLGEGVAALHRLLVDGLEPITVDWKEFIDGQIERCVERQRSFGVEESWLQQIPAFLTSVEFGLADSVRPALLHTELMREHVIVERSDDGALTPSLIDFEPSMVGHPEYEFASAGLFVSCGDADAFRSLLIGYGYSERDLTFDLQRRWMGYALLHRYSNLKWYLDLMPVAGAKTFDELARSWWGITG